MTHKWYAVALLAIGLIASAFHVEYSGWAIFVAVWVLM